MSKPPSKSASIIESKSTDAIGTHSAVGGSGGGGGEPLTFAGAKRYLDSLSNLERRHPAHVDQTELKLDRMKRLLDELDNPEATLRCVHVAGSKGKGSTCEMLAAAIAGCGYHVGLYTSPHLIDIRERIRIGGKPVSQRDFGLFVSRVADAAARLPDDMGPPTYFEALTAAALLAFADKTVDLAVIEVGLGGRLDSTNVVHPDVTLITHLQLEHTAILGDTIDKIAREKAGIFKPGVPAITLPQEDEAMEVLRARAAELGCPFRVLKQEVEGAETLEFTARFEADHEHGPHMRVNLESPRTRYEHIAVPLPGEHQALNAGLALAAMDALTAGGFQLPEIGVAEGLTNTPRQGRLEVINDSPRIVVDGAHTPESLAALVTTVGATMTHDSVTVVFGCAADKRTGDMLAEIGRGADKIIFCASGTSPRDADPHQLAAQFAEITGKVADTAPTVKDAINAAALGVGHEDLILVTGSFYVAGEAKRLLQERAKKHARS